MGGMKTQAFGAVTVIPGENSSRFPWSSTLFIDDDVKAVIDTGAGERPLTELKENHRIDMVINSHFHFDHIAYNHLFTDTAILINEKEAQCYRDRRRIGILLGIEEVYGSEEVDRWIRRISRPESPQSPYSPQNNHKWWMSTSRLDGTYPWGHIFDFGKTKMHVIGAPGHSEGFCCMYFPEEGVVYVADIDLTSFGPWYGGIDGDIGQFIDSCREIAGMDADTFITGHEAGILTKEEFQAGLTVFLEKIEERDSRILAALTEPATIDDVAGKGLIYGRKFHSDEWVFMWNYLMTKKHIERMVTLGRALQVDDTYIST
ncbi:MAG: MBL fold metallo-hydrolase [Deltaproteobacteria bacterium]|nr:MBL fold metallo-hydrolase [Deltaproteobacteria bacterium]MBN2687491.1 MBL fold metallo-hydrolase [Deltaproteobacteria bacterium]